MGVGKLAIGAEAGACVGGAGRDGTAEEGMGEWIPFMVCTSKLGGTYGVPREGNSIFSSVN